MTTNREWLFSKPWEEQLTWLDAEHVAVSAKPLEMPTDGEWNAEVGAPKPQNSQSDAPKSEKTDEIGASKREMRDFDDEHAEGRFTEVGRTSASGMDSREKLLEDANTIAIDYWDRKRTWGEANDLKREVIALLDRQAAIIEQECREYEDELRKQHHRRLHATRCAIAKAGGTWTENEDGSVAVVFAPDADKLEAKLDALKRAVSDAGGMWMEEGGTVTAAFAPDVDELRAERDQWRKRALEAESKGANQRLNSLRNTLRRDWHTDTVWNDALSVYSLRVDPDVLHPIPDFTRNEVYRSSMLERDEIIGDLTAEVEELNAERDTWRDAAGIAHEMWEEADTERNKWRDKFGKALDLAHEIGRIAE